MPKQPLKMERLRLLFVLCTNAILNSKNHDLSHAFSLLDRINNELWHDDILPTNEYERMKFCDANLNPTYLKLVDGVYHHFIYVLAASSRLDRSKNVEGLDLYNCVEEINKHYPNICEPYDNRLRNGIAHGGVIFKYFEIIYKDKKGKERTIQTLELPTIIDELVDACNAMALAIRIFLIQNVDKIRMPQQLMLEELQVQTTAPWWKIEGFLESQIIPDKSQFLVFASPTTYDRFKVLYSALFSAVLCEELAPGYNTYFFSFQSPKVLPGWAIFDGDKLRQVREKGPKDFEDYIGVLESDIVFIPRFKVPIPKFLNRLETYYYSFMIHFPLVMKDFWISINRATFFYRDIKIHRTKSHLFLEGRIVVNEIIEENIQNILRRSRKQIFKNVLRKAKRTIGLLERFFPVGYAKIFVYSTDFRRRKLRGFGLGKELICTIQIKNLKDVKLPDIKDAQIETIGKYRIAWNKSWLDAVNN